MYEIRLRLSAVGCRLSTGRRSQFDVSAASQRVGGPVTGAQSRAHRGFTLVEMLVAMAITLVMMGAVVTLFANLTNSVRNRRATTEMSSQLRHVRNVLQQDLRGATCPGVTWQRPESNHGYIEIIEGQYREGYATNLIDGIDDPTTFNPEIDHAISILPSSNPDLFTGAHPEWATDGGGLGDYDDILMLTSRNEREPFVGRIPAVLNAPGGFKDWGSETIQSPLAEVVWFAMENPATSEIPSGVGNFFGEPGMRTIYRRTLLIAPWVNPYLPYANKTTGLASQGRLQFKPVPGLVRLLPDKATIGEAIAAMIAFQDRYDLSVRLEWDSNLDAPNGRWKIMANTLADLTKRENRFGHFFYRPEKSGAKPAGREYPFALVSTGSGYSGNSATVRLDVTDPDPNQAPATTARATANLIGGAVVSYSVTDPGLSYVVRPLVYVDDDSTTIATAQAMLNDEGQVVRVVHGPVPLWGSRRGEDVMMTDVLGFDLRVYDPGAPIFASRKVPGSTTDFDLDVVLTPSDPGWRGSPPTGSNGAYMDADNMGSSKGIYNAKGPRFQYVGQGAYVDIGYGFDSRFSVGSPPTPLFPVPYYKDPTSSFASTGDPWFFRPRGLSDVYGTQLAPGYAVYDTWSFHFENNGVNEDGYWFDGSKWHWFNPSLSPPAWDTTAPPGQDWRKIVDQAIDGLENDGARGVDDGNERETAPPYDKPLRGMQALIRTYERDSRSIRQVRVNQHFMQE